MKETSSNSRPHERWAHLRFSVVGPLLAAPPPRGQLQHQLRQLAQKKWRHPISGEWTVFGLSTIERWYYKASRSKEGPVEVLKRKIRSDQGQHPVFKSKLAEALSGQYRQHPNWSYQLHADNLAVLVEQQSELGPMPSYRSVLRFMKAHGLFKRPRRGHAHSPGALQAELRFENREIRSYESEYVNGLWHLDFHHGSLRVLQPTGQWVYPILLGVLDDHSRLCCHAQWYLAEGAEELCHGLSQAFQKRQLPRSILFDNGSAMIAAETEQGLSRLSILAENTLPYSPYQNGKQEAFWGQIEGRLLPMLEGVAELTLQQLNEATQAWVEMEYNRKVHSEIGQLQKVIVHTPGREVSLVNPELKEELLFDDIFFEDDARDEHLDMLKMFKAAMPEEGEIIEIIELAKDVFGQSDGREYFVEKLVKSLPEKNIHITLHRADGYVLCKVKDEGPGLTEEDKKKLFSKYQKLSAKPTGDETSTGLGLSIVKKFVEAMDGKIWCESEPGKGAGFYVRFKEIF